MRPATPGGATAAVLAVCALGLIGCSSTTTGTPSPTDSQPPSAGAPTSGSQSPSSADNALTSLNACDLVTNDEVARYKPQGPGTLNTTGSSGASSDCGWIGRSAHDTSMSFGVLVRPEQGVNDLQGNGGTVTHGSANGRPAGQVIRPGGICLIALGVSPKARVDISVVVGGVTDSTEACQVADDLASHVEPRIPKYTG